MNVGIYIYVDVQSLRTRKLSIIVLDVHEYNMRRSTQKFVLCRRQTVQESTYLYREVDRSQDGIQVDQGIPGISPIPTSARRLVFLHGQQCAQLPT